MKETMSAADIRKSNRSQIYRFIYENISTSRPAIAQALQLSRPTVAQNLSDFLEEGLVIKDGNLESTGGRKAEAYHCNSRIRLAVGADIWEDNIQLVILDLFGETVSACSLPLLYSNSDSYRRQFADSIRTFVDDSGFSPDLILGVGISLQGIVSADGNSIIYGDAMNTQNLTRAAFSRLLPWSCCLLHNVDAAAVAEIWRRKNLKEAVYLSLNPHFGGTLIFNGVPHRGNAEMNSAIEHMCLIPDGLPCYCGKRGCVETYCSANSLRASIDMEIPVFFERLRQGQIKEQKIWNGYLRKLALAIDNIRMVCGSEIIIGGYLDSFMTDEDIRLLEDYVREQSAFRVDYSFINRGLCGKNSAAKGAALKYISAYLETI
ncbi:MAG: ROK family transcriptional regulator [Lachnospiraceae bacterium]|nr:ROK family transcriptional regulator [Lachnospiraceae bacterium]